LKNTEGIQAIRVWCRRGGSGKGRKEWVEMIGLGCGGWEGLCTEEGNPEVAVGMKYVGIKLFSKPGGCRRIGRGLI